MFSVKEAYLSLDCQRHAMGADLLKYLATEAGEALSLWDPAGFSQQVMSKTRPAIVLLDEQARQYGEACELGEDNGDPVVLVVNIDELLAAQSAFAVFGPLLMPDLRAHRGKFLGAALDFQGDGDYAERAFFLTPSVTPPGLLSAETVRLTAPAVDELFPEVSSRSLKDETFWGRVSAYEKWLAPFSEQRRQDGVIQIGGWPEFVQTGDADTFIAQYNLGIGDAGGIYVHLEKSGLTADIQMY